jgi:hypothetical protein
LFLLLLLLLLLLLSHPIVTVSPFHVLALTQLCVGCFQNAHKHWLAGWFQDRAITVDPHNDGTSYMRLVGFVDASDARLQDNDIVLIRVAPYLYIHFNVAKGYNIDASEPDTITIIEALADDKISTRKALLKQPGDAYTYVDSETGKVGTVVEVCSVVLGDGVFVSHAMISVHLAGGMSACGNPDLGVWAPNWNDTSNNNNVPVTMAPAMSPDGGTDNDDFGGTPEDNDGPKTTTVRLTLQPAAAPTDQVPVQPTPALPLRPESIPSGSPVVQPKSQPGDQFTGGAIDEEEDQSANATIIGVSVSSVIGGLFLLAGVVYCAVRNETPLSTKNGTEEQQNASQQTPEGSSDKSSNKDHHDITETEVDDWWGGDWFSLDFAKTVGACNRTVESCAKTFGV